MSGEPSTAAPYSTVPSVAVSTRLPAFLATKSSPTPCPPKISSGGTRLSAQLMIVAQGAWCAATALRCCRKVDRAELRMADIALVSRFQRGERLVGRERGRRAFRGPCLPGHAAEPERDDARRAELQQVSPTDPLRLAIAVHNPVPLMRYTFMLCGNPRLRLRGSGRGGQRARNCSVVCIAMHRTATSNEPTSWSVEA